MTAATTLQLVDGRCPVCGAHSRATTTLRTAGRFAVFAAADLLVSVVLSTVLFALVYLSVLLV